jgi:hypothetical protein
MKIGKKIRMKIRTKIQMKIQLNFHILKPVLVYIEVFVCPSLNNVILSLATTLFV